ncbi:hypothetical protein J3454_09700 [Erythrobacter sp. NFXS35]|uniref:hypothetical protein n=1 Tax=Erythrobacter sp. NFXS35 TaxID=2818436 RepID=UPI0032DF207A
MKTSTILAAAVAATTLGAAPAFAQTDMRAAQADYDRAMSENASAERMLSGDVTHAFRQMGEVTDLILDPYGRRVEYILYETPTIARIYGDDDGFVRWDNIEIERGVGAGLDLRIDDPASAEGKDRLQLTRAEANDRMVSRIIGGNMMFADGQMREIDDILFDPDTGMVKHFVIEFDTDSVYTEDTRLIPAAMVSLDEQRGYWMASQPVNYTYESWIY